MSPTSSRAAEVLDRLARDPQARRVSWRSFGAAGGAVAVVLVGVLLLLDRRPPPIEERMPLASEHPAPSITAAPPADAAPAPTSFVVPVLVHIAGAVAEPGVVELPGGSRLVDAVEAAGGLRPDADPDRVNLAAPLEDGQRIVIPVAGEEVPAEILPSGPFGGATASPGSAAPLGTIDLNTATAEQLETLPGIGPATAAAIVAHRESEGPFRSVDALIDVRGIGEAKLDAVRDLVTVSGS